MTAGQLVHANNTIAQLPGFDYAVVLDNFPHVFCYGNAAGTCELLERTDVTDPNARWCACHNTRFSGHYSTHFLQSSSRARQLPTEAEWTSRDDALAWLTARQLGAPLL